MRRRPPTASGRLLASGLMAALAGTAAANFFYLTMGFDYFYALVLLAVAGAALFAPARAARAPASRGTAAQRATVNTTSPALAGHASSRCSSSGSSPSCADQRRVVGRDHQVVTPYLRMMASRSASELSGFRNVITSCRRCSGSAGRLGAGAHLGHRHHVGVGVGAQPVGAELVGSAPPASSRRARPASSRSRAAWCSARTFGWPCTTFECDRAQPTTGRQHHGRQRHRERRQHRRLHRRRRQRPHPPQRVPDRDRRSPRSRSAWSGSWGRRPRTT